MSEAAPVKRRILTADQIEAEINDLALHGEGSDKRWALNKLSNKAEAEVILPPPLDEADIKRRLSRMMRGAGLALTKAAYIEAFQYAPIERLQQAVKVEHLSVVDQEMLPKTLRAFYKRYPHRKKAGMPVGYPQGDVIKQMQWCQKESLAEERATQQAKAATIVADITHVSDLPTDGDDATGQTGPTA